MLISCAIIDILICADFIVRHHKPKALIDFLRGEAPGEFEVLLFRRVYIVAVIKGKRYAIHRSKRSHPPRSGDIK